MRRRPGSGTDISAGTSGARRRLSVFTRVPVPGAAKTRLVPPLTPEQAAALQRAMTEDLLERLDRSLGAATPAAPRLSLEVRYEGQLARGGLDIPSGWAALPQGPGDLGERLRRAVRTAGEEGIRRLVIIGSDAPLLPLHLLDSAFSSLEDHDAVLAPAADGGYVLIAVAVERAPAAAVARMFSGIPWGTGAVRKATATAAVRAGLRIRELPGHWDVDRPGDLLRLAAALRVPEPAVAAGRTAAVLAAAGF